MKYNKKSTIYQHGKNSANNGKTIAITMNKKDEQGKIRVYGTRKKKKYLMDRKK